MKSDHVNWSFWMIVFITVESTKSSPCTVENANGNPVWEHNGWCYVYMSVPRIFDTASCVCRTGFKDPLREGTLFMDPTFTVHRSASTITLMSQNLIPTKKTLINAFQTGAAANLYDQWYWGDRTSGCQNDRPTTRIPSVTENFFNDQLVQRCAGKNIAGAKYQDMDCGTPTEYTCQYSLGCVNEDGSVTTQTTGKNVTVPGLTCTQGTVVEPCILDDLYGASFAALDYSGCLNLPGERCVNGSGCIGNAASCNIVCFSKYGCTAFTLLESTGTCRLHHSLEPHCFWTRYNADAKLYRRTG